LGSSCERGGKGDERGGIEIKDIVEGDINSTLLAARKDLRVSIACELYKRGEISLGKACEIASLNIEEMKEVLYMQSK